MIGNLRPSGAPPTTRRFFLAAGAGLCEGVFQDQREIQRNLLATFSKCINGPFHLPGDVIAKVESSCGNTAITQWLALQHNATLKVESAEERLIRENAELRAQLAKVAA